MMNGRTRVIAFTGGGTGGHVFPAFAVLEALKERDTAGEYRYLWIGSTDGMERELAASRGIPYHGIPAGKLRRYFSLKNLRDLFRVAGGFFQALKVLKREKADILFSKGGFVSVPPVLAAKLLGIPVISHESDLDPGLATRINMRCSRILCLPYEESARRLKGRTGAVIAVTGNPVRREITEGSAAEGRRLFELPDDKPLLLVLGGSQGARQINELVEGALERLLRRFYIVHQMGNSLYAPSAREGYITAPFFGPELPHLLAAAEIVLSRSGAGTLWENGVTQTPALLVPLGAGASRGDQIRNAGLFAQAGAARILEGRNGEAPGPEELAAELEALAGNPALLRSMAEAAGRLCNRDAAQKIAELLRDTLQADIKKPGSRSGTWK